MIKKISGENILGNFIYKSIEHNINSFTLDEVFMFDNKIMDQLLRLPYMTTVSPRTINEALEHFPYIDYINNNYIINRDHKKFTRDTIDNLRNKYRVSLPNFMVNIIDTSYERCQLEDKNLSNYWSGTEDNSYIMSYTIPHIGRVYLSAIKTHNGWDGVINNTFNSSYFLYNGLSFETSDEAKKDTLNQFNKLLNEFKPEIYKLKPLSAGE